MSKYKLENPSGTSLDPFAFEKQFVKPVADNSNDFTGVADQLEFASPVKIDKGYGTLGNAEYAQQVINESKFQDQSSLDLVGKGLFNVVKTIGIEAGKTPGYFGGVIGAVGNELFGDGKESMSMIVDNAWINAFERLDDAAKELVPVYMSKQVQEGNLLDKMGSGAWWAESGADGLGFMLSMFLPGAVAKAAKVGTGIAKLGEGLGNLAPRLGKYATGLGLLEDAGEAGFKFTKDFARNANGVAAASLNTVLESSAEAANTFDSVKDKYVQQGLTEDEAKLKAGEAASAVFKGNMALLFVSNLIDEKWLWKSLGSAGEKEAAQSILSRVTKDGVVDWDMLKQIPKELTRKAMLKDAAKNFGKGILKEGAFEEGSQTTLQQNVEEGKIGKNFLDDLVNVGASYFDDFANNSELHESIFLGGLLGGGASIVSTVRENRDLKKALLGGKGRSSDNFWVKYGILPETKAQKGLLNIVAENHISQFRSYKDFIEDDGQGNKVLNEKKLVDANLEKLDNLRTDALYDLAVQSGNKLEQEIYGQFLAANYAQTFLGQEGNKELFQQHVKEQVVPAWQKRFEQTFGREATNKETSEYEKNFKQSGERVIDAYSQAEQTNYPERYFKENSKNYQDFKNHYFHSKFQTLVALDSVKERRSQLQQELSQLGLVDLNDIKSIEDPQKKTEAIRLREEFDDLEEVNKTLTEHWPKFFTKDGVKQMFDAFTGKVKQFEDLVNQEVEENKDLKEKVNDLPRKNREELDRILDQAEGYSEVDEIPLRDKKGNSHSLIYNPENGQYNLVSDDEVIEVRNYKGDLSELGLIIDDVSGKDITLFNETGEVPESVTNRIAEKANNGEVLTDRELRILEEKKQEIKEIQEKLKSVPENPVVEIVSEKEELDPTELDKALDLTKKKGVNLYPSTGRNAKSSLALVEEGFYAEELTNSPSQKLWFQVLEDEVAKNPEGYTVQVIRKDDKTNAELHAQIQNDIDPGNTNDGDLYTVLYKDGKPLVKNGNYVFTSLWRPENLYPTLNGKPKESILAEKALLENFLTFLKLPKLKVDKITKKQRETLKLAGIENPSEDTILEAAFFHAKAEYTEWYKNLQQEALQKQKERLESAQTKVSVSPLEELVNILSSSKQVFEKAKENDWTLERTLEELKLSNTQKKLVLAQSPIKEPELIKPDLKLEFVTSKELVDSENPIENREAHNKLKQKFNQVLELLNCL